MKELEKYYENHHRHISELSDIPPKKFTQENFHKLRVELKKLNALFDIINYCSINFKRKKSFKSYKLLFKQAGKVRELQLEENLLKIHDTRNSLKKFRANLKHLRSQEQEKYFELRERVTISRDKNIILLLAAIDKESIQNYLSKKEEKISQLLLKKNTDEDELHELRKRLKLMNYILVSLNKKKENKERENLAELLGKWHDCQVMEESFGKAIKKGEVDAKELNSLKRIIKKIAVDKNQFLIEINKIVGVGKTKNKQRK